MISVSGIIGALVIILIGGAFAWLLLQGLARGEIFTLPTYHGHGPHLVRREDNPIGFWPAVSSHAVIIGIILRFPVEIMKSRRRESERE